MPGVTASSGRGLPSIARLAASWGVSYDRRTKGVWFRIPRPGVTTGAEPAAAAGQDAGTGRSEADGGPAGRGPRERAARDRGDQARDGGQDREGGLGGGVGDVPVAADRLLRSPAAVEAMEDGVATVRETLGAEGAAVLLTERDGRMIMGSSVSTAAEIPLGELSVAGLGPAARARPGSPPTPTRPPRPCTRGPWPPRRWSPRGASPASSSPSRPCPAASTRPTVPGSATRGRDVALPGEGPGGRAGTVLARLAQLRRRGQRPARLDPRPGAHDGPGRPARRPRLATWCAVYTVTEAEPDRLAYVWHADENRADGLRELLEHAGAAPPVDGPGPWSGLAAAPAEVRAAMTTPPPTRSTPSR